MKMKHLCSIFIFFFICEYNIFANTLAFEHVKNEKLYDSMVWKRLIHFNNGKPSINDKSFLLSYKDFSPKNELLLTLSKFNENSNYICKFPARYEFLKKNIPNYKIESFKCEEFSKYKKFTNLDTLDLVFVSENVKSPSSMMGHVFFKLNSQANSESLIKTNAISFYTVIDNLNLPLLVYESTIKGMQGYFVLKPYRKQIFTYTNIEERNVWEFNLKLDEDEKRLIYYHFWELKDIDITYYFTQFNCATLVDEILSIAYSKNEEYKNGFWTTPLDVIKKANFNEVIKNGNMLPSLEWNLYMVEKNIDRDEKERLQKLVDSNEYEKIQTSLKSNSISLMGKKFIYYYVKYKYFKLGTLKTEKYKRYMEIFSDNKKININVANYKNPLHRNKDSQITLGYSHNSSEKNFQKLSILLAGNTLQDYDRTSFGESILQIGKIDVKLEDEPSLDRITFYKMKSYLPMTDIQKVYSKELDISYSEDHNLNLSGGIGASFLLHNDILNYNMLDIGINSSKGDLGVFLKPKMGYTIHEVFNLKTMIEVNHIFDSNKNNDDRSEFSLMQSYTKKGLFRIDTSFNKILDYDNEEILFNLTYFF